MKWCSRESLLFPCDVRSVKPVKCTISSPKPARTQEDNVRFSQRFLQNVSSHTCHAIQDAKEYSEISWKESTSLSCIQYSVYFLLYFFFES